MTTIENGGAGLLELSGSVGRGADNVAADVERVRARLEQLGYEVGDDLVRAIRTFQAKAFNKDRDDCDGVVDEGGNTHHALSAGATPSPITVADPDALVRGSADPEVVALRDRIAQLVEFDATISETMKVGRGAARGEEVGADRDGLVTNIADARKRVRGLALADMQPEDARAVRAWGHRRLDELAPYYSQGRNVNFLELEKRTRTCNLTSLAMALEALGKSGKDYDGSLEQLAQIRNYRGSNGEYDYKAIFDKAVGTVDDTLQGLRLPDFLQLVVVANNMNRKGMDLLAAVRSAWDDILVPRRVRDVAVTFGVRSWVRVGLGGSGALEQRYAQIYGAMMDAGFQVVLLTPGHYVRLQGLADEGLMVDDPGGSKKKNMLVEWKDAKRYSQKAILVA